MPDTHNRQIDRFATELIEPVSNSQLEGYLPVGRLIIRDANNGSIIADADFDADVIVDESSYYFDPTKVVISLLEKTDRAIICPYKGTGHWLDLVNDHARVRDAAWVYTDTNPHSERFRNRIGFYSRNFRGTTVKIVSSN